jgi:hypothetical protein
MIKFKECHLMMKIRLAVAALIIAGLAYPTIGVSATSYKHSSKHSSTMSKHSSMAKEPTAKPSVTTGANTKPSSANPSSQGNTGPGTNHAGSMNKDY